jgi:peptide/nickel transport system permease protein
MRLPASSHHDDSQQPLDVVVQDTTLTSETARSAEAMLVPGIGGSAPSATTLRLRDFWRLITVNRKVAVGLAIVVVFLLVALFGPLLLRDNPNAFSNDTLQGPSATHWFGTTQTGQDVFTQVVDGTRVSVLVGFGAGILATILSIIIGLTAGYTGGIIDEFLSLLINIFLVLPGLPLVIVLADYSPVRGPIPIALILTVTCWAWNARILRSQTLSLRQRDFIEASRATGESRTRIIFVEILPNIIGLVVAGFIGTVIYIILAEAGLEFLGLGDINIVSWGTMFYWAQNSNALLVNAWWWFLPPGLCIAILGAALTLLNFGIDEIANPRLRTESKRIIRKRQEKVQGNANSVQTETGA